jgi:hypothetical protein
MGFNTTIAKLKKYVIVTNDFRLANATILQADILSTHFYKSLGKALVDQIESYESSEDVVRKQAFDYLENCLAKLVIDKYLTKGQIMIDNAQITRLENENSKTAYKGQIKDSKEMYFEEAFSIFDLLIDLITANADKFTQWENAPLKVDQEKLLIKTAFEFNEIERLNRKNLTFSALVPTQRNCIDLYLRSRFTADLITELLSNTDLDATKKQVRSYLCTALANFTIATGMKRNQVNFSADGISLILQNENTASDLKTKADLISIKNQIETYEDTGHRFVDLAMNYISNNSEDIDTEDTSDFTKTTPWM